MTTGAKKLPIFEVPSSVSLQEYSFGPRSSTERLDQEEENQNGASSTNDGGSADALVDNLETRSRQLRRSVARVGMDTLG